MVNEIVNTIAKHFAIYTRYTKVDNMPDLLLPVVHTKHGLRYTFLDPTILV